MASGDPVTCVVAYRVLFKGDCKDYWCCCDFNSKAPMLRVGNSTASWTTTLLRAPICGFLVSLSRLTLIEWRVEPVSRSWQSSERLGSSCGWLSGAKASRSWLVGFHFSRSGEWLRHGLGDECTLLPVSSLILRFCEITGGTGGYWAGFAEAQHPSKQQRSFSGRLYSSILITSE
jgi:hypothetical protein